MSGDLHHVAVFVQDMGRALHLFRDLLGFRLAWHASSVDIGGLAGAMGAPLGEVELAYLDGGSGGPGIELMRPIRPAIDPATVAYGARGSGHLSLAVDDLDGLCRRLAAEGWPLLVPPVPVTTAGGDPVRICFFRTEDGLTIELVDRASLRAGAPT